MKAWRIAFAASGIALGLFGVFRLVTEIPVGHLVVLAIWMVAAVAIHDGLLSPLVVSVGWALGRFVPPRPRRYLQGGLISGALITVVAIPLILRSGDAPPSKALLRQNFGGNLTLLLGIVAALSLLLYAAQLARDSRDTGRSVGSTATSEPPGPPESR